MPVEKNVVGRQSARVSVVKYHETVWSDIFPGNYHTVECVEPAVLAAEFALDLSHRQRKRTAWRLAVVLIERSAVQACPGYLSYPSCF
ncbi:MAG: hypothetical protein MUO62_14900 [Anaerolineales bacterium]|nr:hypothetical protein [Anaerolineales bacterium]